MAVEFNKTGFTIRVDTGTNPIDEWMGLHEQLLAVLRIMDASSGITNSEYYLVLMLLQALMPDYDTAIKMTA